MDEANGRPRRTPATITSPALILTRPGDGWRSRRLRKFARRHLDEVLGQGLDPWSLAEPINWSATDNDKTVPERAARGRELLAVGWTP